MEEEPVTNAASDALARGLFRCDNGRYVMVVMTHTLSKWIVRVVANIWPGIPRSKVFDCPLSRCLAVRAPSNWSVLTTGVAGGEKVLMTVPSNRSCSKVPVPAQLTRTFVIVTDWDPALATSNDR